MPAFAVAAPYIAAAAAPIIGKIFGGLFGGGGSDNAIDPETKKQMELYTKLFSEKVGDLEALRSGLGREGDIPRLFLAGSGGSTKKFNESMDAFMEAADFTLARDQSLLKSLLQLNPAGSPSGVTAGGQATNFAANQRATGAVATGLSDLIGDLATRKSADGGENTALADAIANAGAAAPGYGGQGGGLFDFSQVLANAGG